MGDDVAASSSESGLVSSRYAAALLDMAEQVGAADAVERDMNELSAMIEQSDDLRGFVRNPLFDREQQSRTVMAVAGEAQFQTLTSNFLGTLIENRRLSIVEDIIRAFKAEVNTRRGEMTAKVQSAFPLKPEQVAALQDQLGRTMGTHVSLELEINKDLLGGMIVTIGSKQIDSSVRHKLDRLKRAMTQGKVA